MSKLLHRKDHATKYHNFLHIFQVALISIIQLLTREKFMEYYNSCVLEILLEYVFAFHAFLGAMN